MSFLVKLQNFFMKNDPDRLYLAKRIARSFRNDEEAVMNRLEEIQSNGGPKKLKVKEITSKSKTPIAKKLPPLENKDDISFIIKDTFFSVDVFRAICDELTIKKNIIIQGPPGVGKTFIAAKISKYIAGNENRQLNLVFHENYS